jgi:mRNA-degrading endonuclease RelE of RelBE toxin-antitoxin system
MFEIILSDEAQEQFNNLDKVSYKKVFKDFEKFEQLGSRGVDSRDLTKDLWEIRTDNIRTYYSYSDNKIIIVGLIVLKKSQKAPKRFIEQAIRNIQKTKEQL